MPTQQQQPVRAETPIDGHDAIAATVQMYIDGSVRGDTAMLTEAFHPTPRCTAQWEMTGTTSRSSNTSSSWRTRHAARRCGRGPPRSRRPGTLPPQLSSRRDSGGRCLSSPSTTRGRQRCRRTGVAIGEGHGRPFERRANRSGHAPIAGLAHERSNRRCAPTARGRRRTLLKPPKSRQKISGCGSGPLWRGSEHLTFGAAPKLEPANPPELARPTGFEPVTFGSVDRGGSAEFGSSPDRS
jgi:putative lumazine-binding protein